MANDVPQTPNFKLFKPRFDRKAWHQYINDNMSIIDAVLTTYLDVGNIVGVWANSTSYSDGDRVIDPDVGQVFEAAQNHISAVAPTTFAEERVNNPTYWTSLAVSARGLGAWAPGTLYQPNDFVVSGSIYAVCLATHTSSAVFASDATFWDYLIDLSGAFTIPPLPGNALRLLRVNAGETAAEWASLANVSAWLGLGSMALQPAAGVTITGGSITGIIDLAIADGGTAASDAATAFANLKQAASDTATGVVELATQTEVNAGSDTTRVITPATRAGAPRFSVNKNGSTQTATSGAAVTVTWSTEAFDIGSFFAANTWTPPAGYVFLNASVALDNTNGVDQELLILSILKNGGIIKRSFIRRSGTASVIINIAAIDLANGTDAYTVTFQKSGAGNGTIDGTASDTFFEGFAF